MNPIHRSNSQWTLLVQLLFINLSRDKSVAESIALSAAAFPGEFGTNLSSLASVRLMGLSFREAILNWSQTEPCLISRVIAETLSIAYEEEMNFQSSFKPEESLRNLFSLLGSESGINPESAPEAPSHLSAPSIRDYEIGNEPRLEPFLEALADADAGILISGSASARESLKEIIKNRFKLAFILPEPSLQAPDSFHTQEALFASCPVVFLVESDGGDGFFIKRVSEVRAFQSGKRIYQTLFETIAEGIDQDGRMVQSMVCTGLIPHFVETMESSGKNVSRALFAPGRFKLPSLN
jgi:hypothetical protein